MQISGYWILSKKSMMTSSGLWHMSKTCTIQAMPCLMHPIWFSNHLWIWKPMKSKPNSLWERVHSTRQEYLNESKQLHSNFQENTRAETTRKHNVTNLPLPFYYLPQSLAGFPIFEKLGYLLDCRQAVPGQRTSPPPHTSRFLPPPTFVGRHVGPSLFFHPEREKPGS